MSKASEEKEPLFHRFNVEEEIIFDNETPSRDLASSSDGGGGFLNDLPITEILGAFGSIIDTADRNLEEISTAHDNNGNMLGTAIVRGCNELANAVGHIAQELEQQSESDRRALAEACLEDAALALQQQQQQQQALTQHQQEQEELALMSPDDLMSALAGVAPLLRDVEVGLRSIDQTEADEIADVALTLARLFVASLQSFHTSMVHNLEDQQQQYQEHEEERRHRQEERFELLSDDDDNHDDIGDEDQVEDEGNDNSDPNNNNSKKGQDRRKKRREDDNGMLWPPLGPEVAKVLDWGKNEAIRRPILAVALGMTLWPAAVATTVLGVVPLVAVDTIIQHVYRANRNSPIVSNMERGALQLYQAGKLSVLCGELITRQTLRVVTRQIERNGGIGPIVQNVVGMGIDKACHPIETVSEVWDGLHWAWDIVQENWSHHMNLLNHLHPMMSNNNNNERRDATQAQAEDDCWR